LTGIVEGVWGEERKEVPKCHEHIHDMRRNTGKRIIELAQAGCSVSELARQFEPTVEAIRAWIKQAELDMGSAHRRFDHR